MEKLLKCQSEWESIQKNSINPHFKNKYANINAILEAIKPILTKHQLLLLQPIKLNCVMTEVWDGSTLIASCSMELPSNLTPQQLGSAITYFRRYQLLSLFVLETEDTDGDISVQPRAELTKPILEGAIIANMKAAVKAGRGADVEKRLENYIYSQEQKNEILNGK